MSDHSQAFVPIEAWCYSSPEILYQGYAIDVGLMAEALIYYDTIMLNVFSPKHLALLIDWFVRQQKYDDFLSLIEDGTISFYEYSFLTSAVKHERTGDYSLVNMQGGLQPKPNTFEQRFLYDPLVYQVIPKNRKPKHLYSAFRGKVIEAKANEFGKAIDNAREDLKNIERTKLFVQAYVDELYRFKGLGRPPKVEVAIDVSKDGKKHTVIWKNINFDEINKLSGSNIDFNPGTAYTAGCISNRYILSTAKLNCDLFLGKPMSVLVGDKLYESGFKVLKTKSIIDTFQQSVEFPDIRLLTNQAKLGFDEIMHIRSKAEKFRKWLQLEGERDRDALIAYHHEVAKAAGFTKASKKVLSLFGVLGGAAIGGIVESKMPGITGAAIGAGVAATTEFLFSIGEKISNDWKPVIFGDWMKDRIELLLDDFKE
jgi:hypothetical protein